MKMRFLDIGLVKSILPLLPSNAFRKIKFLSLFQITTTILDIVAILLLGLLSKSGLEFVQGKIATISVPYINFQIFAAFSFEGQFIGLSVIVIALFLLRTFLAIWGNRKVLNFLGSQSAFASKQIVNRLFNSKPQYVISKKTQELLYGVTAGMDSLVLAYLGSLVLVVSELFFLSALTGALLLFQPVIGLCSLLIFGGAGYLIHRITSTSIKSDSIESGKIAVKYNQQLLETLQLYREYFLRGLILDATNEVQKLRYRFLQIRANIMFLPIFSKYLFEFVLILGGAVVASIQFSITDANDAITSLVVFLGASSRILPSVIRLQGAALTLKQAEGASQMTLQQIAEFKLNRIYDGEYKEETSKALSSFDFISIDDLYFRYPEQESYTLKNINVTIRKGQLVAIVGESGAGKSTLADLLLGIQEPSSGSIRIDGIPPRIFRELHPGTMAYVPQDIAVLDGSVLKNVTLTNEDESNLEIAIESLERSYLWKDLKKSSLGIHSRVGEGGGNLSGGQKQRLGIARALYTRPTLMVFDEATSSLDPKTEKAVTDAIYASQAGVTLIVIAHRLSTVRKADIVLLLENGELVANGTFEEVRSKSPKFDEQARLVNL